MVDIKITFLSLLADVTQEEEFILSIDEKSSVKDIIEKLVLRYSKEFEKIILKSPGFLNKYIILGLNGEDDLSEKKATKNWYARHAEAEAKKDILSFSKRVGEGVGAGILVILFYVFYVVPQTSSTGFFTSKFGPVETFLVWVPTLLAVVTTVAKVVVGRKNMLRPFETFQMGLGAVGGVWLFVVFPFDFSHLADVLPDFLRFLLLWISNDVAKVLMAIGIIAFSAAAVYTATLYVFVRRELSKS